MLKYIKNLDKGNGGVGVDKEESSDKMLRRFLLIDIAHNARLKIIPWAGDSVN